MIACKMLSTTDCHHPPSKVASEEDPWLLCECGANLPNEYRIFDDDDDSTPSWRSSVVPGCSSSDYDDDCSSDYGDDFSYDDETTTSCTSSIADRVLDHYASSGRIQLVCVLPLLILNAQALRPPLAIGSSSQLYALFAIGLCLFSILSAKISNMKPIKASASEHDTTREKRRWQRLSVFFVILAVLESILCHHIDMDIDMGYFFQDGMEVALMILMILASVTMLVGLGSKPRQILSLDGNEYIVSL